MSERSNEGVSSLWRDYVQEVKVRGHPVLEGDSPVRTIHTLNGVVELEIDSLLLSDFQQRVAELYARREHNGCGGVKMDVGIYFLLTPCLLTEVHYFLWSTSAFDWHSWNCEDCFATAVALSQLRHFLTVSKAIH